MWKNGNVAACQTPVKATVFPSHKRRPPQHVFCWSAVAHKKPRPLPISRISWAQSHTTPHESTVYASSWSRRHLRQQQHLFTQAGRLKTTPFPAGLFTGLDRAIASPGAPRLFYSFHRNGLAPPTLCRFFSTRRHLIIFPGSLCSSFPSIDHKTHPPTDPLDPTQVGRKNIRAPKTTSPTYCGQWRVWFASSARSSINCPGAACRTTATLVDLTFTYLRHSLKCCGGGPVDNPYTAVTGLYCPDYRAGALVSARRISPP